jgi:hypothetical protein
MEGTSSGTRQEAWAAHASLLSDWAFRRLVNRTDIWGGYWREENGRTRPTTRPHPRDRGKYSLTKDILANHFAADETRSIAGLHTTSTENTSRWGAVEIDWHGESSFPAKVNLAAALHWHDVLCRLGFQPLFTDSNGKGGYHLLTLFSEHVPTSGVFAFLKWLVRDHADHGLTLPPETFPKQPSIKPGGCGNWLRLPGRHHTREHWSRVWDGSRWLDGAAAIDLILSRTGDPPTLIPAAALAPKVTISIRSSYRQRVLLTRADKLTARIHAYLAKLPDGLGEGQHRDDYGYCFAAFLVRDLGLSDAEALPWLEEWDTRNAVPKGPDCLRKLLASAHAYGNHAYGSGLTCPRRV